MDVMPITLIDWIPDTWGTHQYPALRRWGDYGFFSSLRPQRRLGFLVCSDFRVLFCFDCCNFLCLLHSDMLCSKEMNFLISSGSPPHHMGSGLDRKCWFRASARCQLAVWSGARHAASLGIAFILWTMGAQCLGAQMRSGN